MGILGRGNPNFIGNRFIRPQLCPKRHPLKLHRTRDPRDQYYCELCDHYYTPDSRLKHIYEDSNYFDGFISDYITLSLQNKKPSIAKLCKQHKISRASTYRHLLDNGNKLILDTFILLKRWAIFKLNGNCQTKIRNKELVVKRLENHLIIHLHPILILNSQEPAVQIVYVFNNTGSITPPINDYQRLDILIKESDSETLLFDHLSSLIDAN